MKRSWFYKTESLTNIVVILNKKEYKLHDVVLNESFDFFKTNSYGKFKQEDKIIIDINDYDGNPIKDNLVDKIFMFAYDLEKYDFKGYHDNLSMYILADFLLCEELKNYYKNKLVPFLNRCLNELGINDNDNKISYVIKFLEKMEFKCTYDTISYEYSYDKSRSYKVKDMRYTNLSNKNVNQNIKSLIDLFLTDYNIISEYAYAYRFDRLQFNSMIKQLNICKLQPSFDALRAFEESWKTYKKNLIEELNKEKEKEKSNKVINFHEYNFRNLLTVNSYIQLNDIFPEISSKLVYLVDTRESIENIKAKLGHELFNKNRRIIYIKKSFEDNIC